MKKMAIVPADILNTIRGKQRYADTQNPEIKHMIELDKEMQSILHKDGVDDYEKALLYNQVLGKYLQHNSDQRYASTPPEVSQTKDSINSLTNQSSPSNVTQPGAVVDETVSGEIEDIMNLSVPKTLRSKAAALIKHFRKNNITWDDKGTIAISGKSLDGSNIIDIVNSAVRTRKTSKSPEGEDILLQHLKTTNTPKEIIGNKEWLHTLDSSLSAMSSNTPVQSTPRLAKNRSPLAWMFSEGDKTPQRKSKTTRNTLPWISM